MADNSAQQTKTDQKTTPCSVPECRGGYVRVPVIVEQDEGDAMRHQYVRVVALPCAECNMQPGVPVD